MSALASVGLGAICVDEGVRFRVWAPERKSIDVLYPARNRTFALARGGDGFFSGTDSDARAGERYDFRLDGDVVAPDPASRFQPEGVFGPSMIVDPRSYAWKSRDWIRPASRGRVIYELHVGTFSKSGTFRGVIEHLDDLVELGVNTIELMPIHEFAGRWNWGYDGVLLYAPARCYGTPGDLRALVDAAHTREIAVMLDVVYNHLGATGNVLPTFSPHYFHATRESGWGRSLNFDGENAPPVREFFLQNACYWLDEFRIDGLRLDATHAIEDSSPNHLLAEIAAAAHERGAFVIAEDERNEARLIAETENSGWGLDGVWADDFHHTVRVALTGENQGYFAGFSGAANEWADTLLHGWLYRGQTAPHIGTPRGTPVAHLPPERFVHCISNHDQVGNRALGERLHHDLPLEFYRAVSMLLCLSPYTPMLFMGQEWGASTPFLYFTDHPGELGQKMAHYRAEEFRQRGINADTDIIARMPDPQAESTFASSVLQWDERYELPFRQTLALYRECLGLRARETIFQNPPRSGWSVRTFPGELLALRWKNSGGDWLLLVDVRSPVRLELDREPFFAPHEGRRWSTVIFSNDLRFGRHEPPPLSEDGLTLLLDHPAACLLREI